MTYFRNRTRSIAAALLAATMGIAGASCKTVPPPKPPTTSFEQKMTWILQLEDQRSLRMPAPVTIPAPPTRGRSPQVAPVPPPTGDLIALLNDTEPRVRRRAALAIGRVGLVDGVAPLAGALTDTDPEVRQMVAFAIGLIGDPSGVPALTQAL